MAGVRGRIVVFGEVLFDRFPDGSEVLGGAPFNVAWNLKGLGEDPLLVSRVGDDGPGRRIRTAMERFGLDTSGLQVDASHATGTVEVSLDKGQPSFDIVGNRAYDHIQEPAVFRISVLYLGTLALRQPISRATALHLLEASQGRVFVDVNLRPPWWQHQDVLHLLERAHEIKLNDDELRELFPDLGDQDHRATRLLESSGAERVWVTRGARGAAVYSASGPCLAAEPRRGLDVVDTVGAGDAFSSVLLLGGLRSWDLPETLDRAQEWASAVVGLRGATTEDDDFYGRFRSKWTPDSSAST
jgi:fructokinase